MGLGANMVSFNIFNTNIGHWYWASVKAGIRDRTTEYIVSENSWPIFMYENYKVNNENLEEGFLKSKILVLVSYCDGLEVLVLVSFRSLWYSRPSKPFSRLLPLQRKLTVMAMVPTSSRVIGALVGNQIRRRLNLVSLLSSAWVKWRLVPSLTLCVK